MKHAGGNLLKKCFSLTFLNWQHSKFNAKSSLTVMQFWHVQKSRFDSKHCKPAIETWKTVSSVEKWLQTSSNTSEISVSSVKLVEKPENISEIKGLSTKDWTPWVAPPALALGCWSSIAGQLQDSSQFSCPSCHVQSQDSFQLSFQTCAVSYHDWSSHQEPSSCHHMSVLSHSSSYPTSFIFPFLPKPLPLPLPFFPFCFPLPLITPFPFFLSRQFAEIWPNFWHLKHFSFDKSTSHAFELCLLLPHVPHRTPPTASKFQFPSPSLADISYCTVDSSEPSTWVTWYRFILGWNSAKARCCCSHLSAVALNAWYDSPPVWCKQNVLTASGRLRSKTATKSASATCNPVASILLDSVPSNLEYLAISKSIFLIVSVTIVLALVSFPCSAKDFPASAVLKLSASLLVLMLHSRVSCLTSSKPFEACNSAFTPTSALHKLIPSLNALINVKVLGWFPNALLKIASNLLLLARCGTANWFQCNGSGHLQACSISLPNSRLACIAQAVKS